MEYAIVVDVERIHAKIKQVRKVIPGEGMNTIFRVPTHICQGREDLFRPHMVAIGPYHRGRTELQKMEQVKWQFLLELKEKSKSDLSSYVEALRGLEERARACYFDEVFLDTHEFIEMLLLDGCFIVQFLIKYLIPGDAELSVVCGNSWWSIGTIKHDLFLLENQIPFIVLQELFELISPLYFRSQKEVQNLQQMVFQFLVMSSTSLSIFKEPDTSLQPHHMLHLCYLCYTKTASVGSTTRASHETNNSTSRTQRKTSRSKNSIRTIRIYSAANLARAGVRFRKREKADTFFGIEFTADGILEIPFISVDEDTMHRLANLVALEQCDADVGTDITAYAFLMDCLIDTSDDVEVLWRGKILGKMMASNKEVADFFNQLCAYSLISTQNNRLAKVFTGIEEYCNNKWHERRAILMQDYFSNPWTSISVVVALMILLFTASQSFMGFYSIIQLKKTITIFLIITIIPPILMMIFITIKKIT